MKRLPLHLLLPAAAMLWLASCTADVPDGNSLPAIGFTPQAADTRAVVESPADMTAFQVWGWYGTTANPTGVFQGDEVRRTGDAWTYDDLRYWMAGQTYNFYALHPCGLSGATCNSDGTLTIPQFACGAGNTATDLMTARAIGLNGSDAPVVNLTFNHELVRITVDIKSDITTTFRQLQLQYMPAQGTFTQAADGTSSWESVSPATYTSAHKSISAGDELADVFGTVLAIPQLAGTGDTPRLHLVYQDETTGTDQTKDIPLPATDEWAAGKSYRYTCTITGAQSQLTIYYTVEDWTGKEIEVPEFK